MCPKSLWREQSSPCGQMITSRGISVGCTRPTGMRCAACAGTRGDSRTGPGDLPLAAGDPARRILDLGYLREIFWVSNWLWR